MLLTALFSITLLFLILSPSVTGHGYHPKAGANKPQDWAEYHMQEEHHVDNFDAASFFTLHDFNGDGSWDKSEVRQLYGLDDPSLRNDPQASDLTETHVQQILQDVFALFDHDRTGLITREEFLLRYSHGFRLPDFGYGPGHHGDDEYEYEIHHFEKFHGGDDDVRLEDLTHPEDIEHFRKHDRMEDEAERIERLEQRPIVDENIPGKFRVGG